MPNIQRSRCPTSSPIIASGRTGTGDRPKTYWLCEPCRQDHGDVVMKSESEMRSRKRPVTNRSPSRPSRTIPTCLLRRRAAHPPSTPSHARFRQPASSRQVTRQTHAFAQAVHSVPTMKEGRA